MLILARNIIHLMTGPEGNVEFCFPRVFRLENTEIRGGKNDCSPRDHLLSDLLYKLIEQK